LPFAALAGITFLVQRNQRNERQDKKEDKHDDA